jgi:hypothetical protein
VQTSSTVLTGTEGYASKIPWYIHQLVLIIQFRIYSNITLGLRLECDNVVMVFQMVLI